MAIFFSDRPENTSLVDDVEILLPVKFSWIPFSGFRGEVKNVSAYQRPGRPSCFSDRPEKHKLGRKHWDLAPCQVSLNSVQRFKREFEIVSANQRPGRPFCFFDRPEKHKIGRGCWDLASCQVWLNFIQRFQRRSWKCEKLTTDGRQTDGRTTDKFVITIVHLSLRLRCTKKEEIWLSSLTKALTPTENRHKL